MRIHDSDGTLNHIVPLSNGVLRSPHVKRIGPALPLFAKLEDLVTTGEGSDGIVLGRQPVSDQQLADWLGGHRKTIADWRRRLMKHGYITSRPTPAGNVLRVRKSKKWLWLRSMQATKRAAEVGVKSLQGGSESQPGGIENGRGWDRKRDTKQDLAVQKQDVEDAATAATATIAEAWNAIRVDLPIGNQAFQKSWEFFYAARNGALLSEAMERCIQACQRKGLNVPPPFFEAKRHVEAEKRPAPATAEDQIPFAEPYR